MTTILAVFSVVCAPLVHHMRHYVNTTLENAHALADSEELANAAVKTESDTDADTERDREESEEDESEEASPRAAETESKRATPAQPQPQPQAETKRDAQAEAQQGESLADIESEHGLIGSPVSQSHTQTPSQTQSQTELSSSSSHEHDSSEHADEHKHERKSRRQQKQRQSKASERAQKQDTFAECSQWLRASALPAGAVLFGVCVAAHSCCCAGLQPHAPILFRCSAVLWALLSLIASFCFSVTLLLFVHDFCTR